MMLRQYFMSLKVLGRWKRWSSSLGHHLGQVHKDMQHNEGIRVRPSAARCSSSTLDHPPLRELVSHSMIRRRKTIVNGQTIDSDSEEELVVLTPVPTTVSQSDRELFIMRKVMRIWWRRTGLPGHPSMSDQDGGESRVGWSEGIAPCVDGRITIVSD